MKKRNKEKVKQVFIKYFLVLGCKSEVYLMRIDLPTPAGED